MVLKRQETALLLAALSACLQTSEPVRLAEPAPIGIVAVLDHDDARPPEPAPAYLVERLAAELAQRNLQTTAFAPPIDAFGAQRTTEHRLAQLAGDANAPELVLLVETKADYEVQIEGRYRWTVRTRLTLAHRGESERAVSVDLEVPVFLEQYHEREPAALSAAAPAIARRTGGLADAFLGAPSPRAAAPADDAIYFVLVDRFANGDPTNDGAIDLADPQAFHGGDLQGVLAHLDDIAALGVRTVWLSPVFQTRTEKYGGHGAFHGYWTEDLGRVEPRFGDEATLRRLADALHARGMRLVLDMVLNHVGPDAPLAREHPELFHHEGGIVDWNDPVERVRGDVHGLPDFAQEDPRVEAYLLERSRSWLERIEPDGLRIDAVRHMPLDFLARYNRELRASAPGLFLLGEAFDGDPLELAHTLRAGDFDALFDFALHFALTDVFCRDQPVGRLASVLSLDRVYGAQPPPLVTLADNHDLPRLSSACAGSRERVEQVLAFQLTARGVPSLTYGTEIGLEGAQEPANRADMRFEPQHPLRAHIARLLALRRAHPALTRGASVPLVLTDDLFVYARVYAGDAVVIAVNRGSAPARLPFPASDLVSGAVVESVPPRALLILTSTANIERWPEEAHTQLVVEARGASGELRLVGAGPELGRWHPQEGLAFRREGDRFVLEADLPRGLVLEYKLVARAPDGADLWEPGPNRYLLLSDARARVETSWRTE